MGAVSVLVAALVAAFVSPGEVGTPISSRRRATPSSPVAPAATRAPVSR
ncbi:hypothetical protein [Bailinhaonella thermotolerans]|nr:hypothetical protein [Bailinhaonella thermotolerans]